MSASEIVEMVKALEEERDDFEQSLLEIDNLVDPDNEHDTWLAPVRELKARADATAQRLALLERMLVVFRRHCAQLSENERDAILHELEASEREATQQGEDERAAEVAPSAHKKPVMQPIVIDDKGIARFRENRIVRDTLKAAERVNFSLNTIAVGRYDDWEREQFSQLIGYSVSGYGDLYPDSPSVERADRIVEQMIKEAPHKK